MDKKVLRKEFIQKRKNVCDKKEKSNIILSKILNLSIYKSSNNIALYCSLEDEVETFDLIKKTLLDGKLVHLPVTSDNNIEFYKIDNVNNMKNKGKFGIYEPKAEFENKLNKGSLDLIIVPGVCFDKNKNRIGFGKGYYDKYLEDLDNVQKVGICFEEQILKNKFIDIDKHDIKMDLIVTNENIYD